MTLLDFDECPCSGKSMSTLVAPWILLTLYHHEGTHGYELQKLVLSHLEELGLGLNMTGLYRHLNLLEKRGASHRPGTLASPDRPNANTL